MSWTIIIQSRPDAPGNPAFTALRLAGAAVADGETVCLFLVEGALQLALKTPEIEDERLQAQRDMLCEFIELGMSVQACGMCLTRECKSEGDLLPGVAKGSMKTLVASIRQSEKVLTF